MQRLISRLSYGALLLAIVVSMTSRVAASNAQAVPEIDGNSIATGLGLLTAGILIVRTRLRR